MALDTGATAAVIDEHGPRMDGASNFAQAVRQAFQKSDPQEVLDFLDAKCLRPPAVWGDVKDRVWPDEKTRLANKFPSLQGDIVRTSLVQRLAHGEMHVGYNHWVVCSPTCDAVRATYIRVAPVIAVAFGENGDNANRLKLAIRRTAGANEAPIPLTRPGAQSTSSSPRPFARGSTVAVLGACGMLAVGCVCLPCLVCFDLADRQRDKKLRAMNLEQATAAYVAHYPAWEGRLSAARLGLDEISAKQVAYCLARLATKRDGTPPEFLLHVLCHMQDDEAFRAPAVSRLDDLYNSCSDRRARALNDLYTAFLVRRAECADDPRKALRGLATQLTRLEIVHRHAGGKRSIDEVERYLAGSSTCFLLTPPSGRESPQRPSSGTRRRR